MRLEEPLRDAQTSNFLGVALDEQVVEAIVWPAAFAGPLDEYPDLPKFSDVYHRPTLVTLKN
jgi:hypothetical protein